MFLMLGLWAVAFSFAYSVREFFRYLEKRDEHRRPERELALLPEMIKVFGDVTGDQGKAEELSALLAGIVRGRTTDLPARLDFLDEKMDRLLACVEQDPDGSDVPEEEEEDPLSPHQLMLEIHNEHSRRVQALFDNITKVGGIRPSPRELVALLHALRPGMIDPETVSRRGRREGAPPPDEAPAKEESGEQIAEPLASPEEAPSSDQAR